MTKQEVIDLFEHNWTKLENHDYTEGELVEALNKAIKALEQEPYKDFCEFVAKMVLRDDFEENAGANAELLCRKLSKIGIVKADKDEWVLVESEE